MKDAGANGANPAKADESVEAVKAATTDKPAEVGKLTEATLRKSSEVQLPTTDTMESSEAEAVGEVDDRKRQLSGEECPRTPKTPR